MTVFDTLVDDVIKAALSPDSRQIVAIVGVPASGKTTVAALLAKIANERIRELAKMQPHVASLCAAGDLVQLMPMDGFHLTRETLTNRRTAYSSEYTADVYDKYDNIPNDDADTDLYYIDGYYRPWPDVKTCFERRGAHWTFDAKRFAMTLEGIRDAKPNDPPFLVPGWDHATKDPDWDAISITGAARVVLVEGLYCILDIAPWERATNCVDWAILVECDEAETLRRGSVRNFKAGICSTLEASEQRWHINDIPNGRFLLQHSRRELIKYRLQPQDLRPYI